MRTTIDSRSGWFRVRLADDDPSVDGIAVEVFQKLGGHGAPFKRIATDCLLLPFHAACDRMVEVVEALRREPARTTDRYTVHSITN